MKIIKEAIILTCMLLCVMQLLGKQQGGKYIIQGSINGLPDGRIYLVKNGGKDTIAVSTTKAGQFRFMGRMAEEGELYFVRLDKAIKLDGNRKTYIRLMLDHSVIRLNGDFAKWPDISVKGSVATDEFNQMSTQVEELRKQSEQRYNAIISSPGMETKLLKKAELNHYYQNLFELFKQYPSSYSTSFIMFNFSPDSIAYLKAAHALLNEKVKKGYYAQCILRERIPFIKMKSKIALGKRIPDFQVTTQSGKQISIVDITMKGRVTLVDFWASWCKPCRSGFPELKKLYEEFHATGFNVVGISSDHNEVAWKKALTADQLPWTNVLDKSGKTNEIFGLSGIPAYALLDEEGKFIAFSAVASIPGFGPPITGEQLRKTLKDLLDGKR